MVTNAETLALIEAIEFGYRWEEIKECCEPDATYGSVLMTETLGDYIECKRDFLAGDLGIEFYIDKVVEDGSCMHVIGKFSGTRTRTGDSVPATVKQTLLYVVRFHGCKVREVRKIWLPS